MKIFYLVIKGCPETMEILPSFNDEIEIYINPILSNMQLYSVTPKCFIQLLGAPLLIWDLVFYWI